MSVSVSRKQEFISTAEPTQKAPRLNQWMDDCLQRFNKLVATPTLCIAHIMTAPEVIEILRLADQLFLQEPTLLEEHLAPPIKIIGDLSGQFQDLAQLFQLIGKVPEEKLLFLGNYVGIGAQGIECFVWLCCLKIRHKDRIFMLRGNNELPAVNRMYNFYSECVAKYGHSVWWEFQCTFNRLPLAALISQKVLCVHGGLSPELTSLNAIREIQRPLDAEESGLAIDLLWSDPTNRGDGWFKSLRGIGYMFGKQVVEETCKKLGVDLIIRSHLVVQDGFEVMAGGKVLTVFSTRSYMGTVNNSAAVICLDAKMELSYQQLLPDPSSPTRGVIPVQPLTVDLNPATALNDKEKIKLFLKW